MTTQEILNAVRQRLDDAVGNRNKYLWSTDELIGDYANAISEELARELYLLHEVDLIGYVVIAGTAGSVDSVSVSGLTITSGSVAFSSSTANTARLVAQNINAYNTSPSPRYRASFRGPVVYIRAIPNTGYPAAGYSIATTATTLTATATDLPGLCRNLFAADQRYSQMNERVIQITRFKPSTLSKQLSSYRRDEMDVLFPGWETYASGASNSFIPDYDNLEVIVSPPPTAAMLIEADCYRLPLVPLSGTDLLIQPEVQDKYHQAIVYGCLAHAFGKRDVESRNDQLATYWGQQYRTLLEKWRVERVRRTPAVQSNQMPRGVF